MAAYIARKFKLNVHFLECQLHISEILFSHVLNHVEGKTTGPGRRAAGTAYNIIPKIPKPTEASLILQSAVSEAISLTDVAKQTVTAKLQFYSDRREEARVT